MSARSRWLLAVLFIVLLSGSVCPGEARVVGEGRARAAASPQPAGAVASASPQASDDALLALLPLEFRDMGSAILREKDKGAREQLVWKLEDATYAGAWDAPLNPDVVRFVVALEDAGRCSSRWQPCVGMTAHNLRTTHDPALRQALERWVASHPDPDVVTAALSELQAVDADALSALLGRRIELARSAGDAGTSRRLGRAQEGLGSYGWGLARLPLFFWDPPAVFSVRPTSAAIRVLAISDFGTGYEHQRLPADAMLKVHHARPFDFGITLGDNYQDDGAHGPADPRWKEYWEREYSPLAISFYASMGNHDWGTPEGPAAEILYSQRNPQWHLPAPYYTYTAGPVQFFVVNTVLMSEAQLLWLQEELRKSAAKWKVVYGHYQIYSAVRGDDEELIKRLLPILEEAHVDLYLCGHEHLFQHLKLDGGVHFFVNAAAGGGGRPIEKRGYHGLLFSAEKREGFTVLEADASALTVRFVADGGRELYAYTFRK
jgi:hypothetical protein